MKDNANYLRDVLSELNDIAAFTAEGRARFMVDRKTQKAVVRCYEIVGEAVKRLSDDFRAAYPHVNWRRLSSFRDFLVHNYDEIILQNVWLAVEDLPNLRSAIESLLRQLEQDAIADQSKPESDA